MEAASRATTQLEGMASFAVPQWFDQAAPGEWDRISSAWVQATYVPSDFPFFCPKTSTSVAALSILWASSRSMLEDRGVGRKKIVLAIAAVQVCRGVGVVANLFVRNVDLGLSSKGQQALGCCRGWSVSLPCHRKPIRTISGVFGINE